MEEWGYIFHVKGVFATKRKKEKRKIMSGNFVVPNMKEQSWNMKRCKNRPEKLNSE